MILIYADGFPLGTVFRQPSFVSRHDVVVQRGTESVLADALRPLYKSVIIDSDSRYEANMMTRYVVVDQPLFKVDVNSMYPTALLQLWRLGRVRADSNYISIVYNMLKWRQRYHDGYVVALNVTHSDYAVYKKDACKRPCRTADVADYIEKFPADFSTAVKTLNDLPCCGVVLKAKDLSKYTLLIAVGRIKAYDTASWHSLISYAHERFLKAIYEFKKHENEEAVAVYVDTAFLFAKASQFMKYLQEVGFDSKLDAYDGHATLLLAVNYHLDGAVGAWLLGIDDLGYQDGFEAECRKYPRACSLCINQWERFGHAGRIWCSYIQQYLPFVKCVMYKDYVEIYVLKQGIWKVDIRWSEKTVLDAIKAAKSETYNYFYGFL